MNEMSSSSSVGKVAPATGEEELPKVRILRRSNPVLRQRAREVRRVNASVQGLVPVMEQVMHRMEGVGLAAPQIGLGQRISVIDVGDGLLTLVNPRIVARHGSEEVDEGCLSLPGLYGKVRRYAEVVVEARDEEGRLRRIKGTGLLARALQHEIDHLNGVLFTDRVDPETLHWLVKPPEGQAEGKSEIIPTTLQQALNVFEAGPPVRELPAASTGLSSI